MKCLLCDKKAKMRLPAPGQSFVLCGPHAEEALTVVDVLAVELDEQGMGVLVQSTPPQPPSPGEGWQVAPDGSEAFRAYGGFVPSSEQQLLDLVDDVAAEEEGDFCQRLSRTRGPPGAWLRCVLEAGHTGPCIPDAEGSWRPGRLNLEGGGA